MKYGKHVLLLGTAAACFLGGCDFGEESTATERSADKPSIADLLSDVFGGVDMGYETASDSTVVVEVEPTETTEGSTEWEPEEMLTLTVDENGTVTRSAETDYNLTWQFCKDGEVQLERNANNELSYRLDNGPGEYTVTLLSYFSGYGYMPVSNTVSYTISASPDTQLDPIAEKVLALKSVYKNICKQYSTVSTDTGETLNYTCCQAVIGDFYHTGTPVLAILYYDTVNGIPAVSFHSENGVSDVMYSLEGLEGTAYHFWNDAQTGNAYVLVYLESGTYTCALDVITKEFLWEGGGDSYQIRGADADGEALAALGYWENLVEIDWTTPDYDNVYVIADGTVVKEGIYSE